MALDAIGRKDADGAVVVVGGIFESTPELLLAHRSGELRGAVNLSFTPEMIGSWSGAVREAWGRVLALCPVIFAADSWSLEQIGHVGLGPDHVKLGTWVEWIGIHPPGYGPSVAMDVEEAIHATLAGVPVWLLVEDAWGSPANRAHHPLHRWAVEMGVSANVCFSWPEIEERRKTSSPVAVPEARVRHHVELAKSMLAVLGSKADVDPLSVIAPVGRTLEIGAPFDEQIHYGPEYYGGGEGIRYKLPNGSSSIYQSTAHTWEGFAKVAGWLLGLGAHGRLLDLGCGAGGFVKPALEVGFDAVGVDISEAAVAKGLEDEQLRDRLFVGDISNPTDPLRQILMAGTRDVVTAFDLLEHIFASDVDALVARIASALRRGGLGVFNICTRGDGEKDYEFARQEAVTVDNSWLLVAGHVTIHTWEWWREMFAAYGLRARLDLCQLFQVRRAEDPTMKLCESWSARNLLIVEKAP